MNNNNGNPRNRRGLTFVAMAALLGMAAIGLTQCRVVENVSGLELQRAEGLSGKGGCIKHCKDQYKDARKREGARHREAIRACDHDADCRRREHRLHDRNLDEIAEAKRKCQSGCYNEGGGLGGR